MQSVFLATISLNAMAGGLEKNIVLLANYLSSHGFDVQLITFDNNSASSFYKIDKAVRWHKVGTSEPHAPIDFFDRLQLIKRIRMVIGSRSAQKPPIIVCFHHGILARFFLASVFTGAKIICSERNSLSLYKHIRKQKWNFNFLLLSLVQKIVVQYPDYILDYPFWLRRKIISIPNPVFPVKKAAKPDIPNNNGRFNILSVGRLSTQKQQHLLIQAFGKIANLFPEWDLTIIGEGGLRLELKKIIKQYSLENRVTLLGNTPKISEWMQQSHIFSLPSQWEGFPNALSEALSSGLPAIGFAECEGINQLILSGKNGLLAPGIDNFDTLALALKSLMKDGETRVKMGREAINSIKQFNPQRVFALWENLLLEMTEPGSAVERSPKD